MTFTIPTIEPSIVMAGETWHWTIELADFPPSESWALTYYFRGPGTLDVVATPQVATNNYDVTATAAQTAALLPGLYRWLGVVVSGTEKHVARPVADDSGTPETWGELTVLQNLITAAAGDLQTHAEKTLAAIETEIYNRINNLKSIESYVVAGRQIAKIPFEKLVKMRSLYQAMVRRERNPGSVGTDVAVSFGLPT